MKRWFLTPALGLVALTVALPAHAQSSGWFGDSRPSYGGEPRQSYNDSRRVAYDTGYREGLKEGEKDGRHGDAFRFQDEKGYQRADKGFHREYGDVERYRQSFRTGYAAGYSDSYQRFAPRSGYGNGRNDGYRGRVDPGRDPSWSRGPYGPAPGTGPGYGYPGRTGGYNPALQNGVDDGYEKGIEDAQKRRSFDPLRHQWYRSADRNYEGRFGSKEQYKDIYREGFRSGYERGYRGYR
jgi:hypothetical protein